MDEKKKKEQEKVFGRKVVTPIVVVDLPLINLIDKETHQVKPNSFICF